MALAPALSRDEAHARVADACRQASMEHRHLREVLAADATITGVLDARALDALFDPAGYLGLNDTYIDRVLARTDTKDP
jgi:3-carboxy-cis,cis-muconate cycloisomerase